MSRPRHYAQAAQAKRTQPDQIEPEQDSEGPRGTYGCACVADSARMCALLRYDRDIDSHEQNDDDCECLCHQWRDEEPEQEQEE